MFNYFAGCRNQDEVKEHYRKLALENHPDCSGSEETMKEINAQYQIAKAQSFAPDIFNFNGIAGSSEGQVEFSVDFFRRRTVGPFTCT